jgi:UDP-N-acetylmuramoyl-tripeptide--D-alanyl-D-alanine ligase
MRGWNAPRIAQAAGAELVVPATSDAGPQRVVIDSRAAGPGDLFVGLRGGSVDGGRFASEALRAGAWGVLAAPDHPAAGVDGGAWLSAQDPLAALQRLAREWRRELGADVVGVTGSTGKTSTKDLLYAVLAPHRRTIASRGNFNTEIGLPVEILGAPAGTEVLVLEMAMRGAGQIAELAAVAEPDVGVIVSIGPVHLELLGSIESIAASKAELIAGLAPGATAVIPAGESLLDPYLRDDLTIVTFGEGGDVALRDAGGDRVEIDAAGDLVALEVPFTQAHLRGNLLAAVAAARAIGVDPEGRVELELSPGRGQRAQLRDGVMLIDDCYNANPMSMRAALDDLAETATRGRQARRVAVLGDMLELGSGEREFHLELGTHAMATGVDVLITVGPLAAAMIDRFNGEAYAVADAGEAAALLPDLLAPGDAVLVKASRGVGLDAVCAALQAGAA